MAQPDTIARLSKVLKGAVVERVEPPVGASEGHFTLVCRRGRDDGKLGKVFFVRVSGTDLGWWFETRVGTRGKWQEHD